eukprot:Plantae.Rhodophyta-Hildenbrandia_rubra.ctg21109.p1 GENE.Plantae.Rhodophyta-Hildenbrandia_rubra.ctg21109~~Plantae.Rhodophyta-Hildenbrandia_rubra.ctg21109.p1  ORF type:complete len:604 (+),score=99.79 Plantae.Rhodophyta-Hildenbrandia_rubra.ctg21109:1023-2834(+)
MAKSSKLRQRRGGRSTEESATNEDSMDDRQSNSSKTTTTTTADTDKPANGKEYGTESGTTSSKTADRNGKSLKKKGNVDDDDGNQKSDGTKPKPYKTTAQPIWPTLSAGITMTDVAIAVLFFVVALGVRMYKLSSPAQVIFDEMHYIKFANWTLQGKFFFDVNPYFGKLVIAYLAYLLGYDPNVFPDPHPEDPYPNTNLAWAGRMPSAILGSATVSIFYRLCRQLRLSREAAAFGAFCMLFDTMSVVQSRMNMVDIILVFFTCASLLCALLLWDAKKIIGIKKRHITVTDVFNVALYLMLVGSLSGLAIAVRWTAFATPLAIVIVSMFGVPPFCVIPLNTIEMLALVGSMFGGYFGSFALLFYTMSNSGSGDAFMSKEFQACLKGSKQAIAAATTGVGGCSMNYWQRFVEINKVIFRYSKGVRGQKSSGATWYQWIVNWRGTLYHSSPKTDPSDPVATIYLIMNPAMVLLVNASIVCFLVGMCLMIRYRKTYRLSEASKSSIQRAAVLLFAWILSMLPTMVVYRAGPVYQYLPGLIFAQAAAAVAFDMLPSKSGRLKRIRTIALVVSAGLMVAAFIYWAPWVYALPLPMKDHVRRRWLPMWKI